MSSLHQRFGPRNTPLETTGKVGLTYHGGKTRVYTTDHSPRWHADKRCPELRDVDQAIVLPLGYVLTTETNPHRPCDRCTCDLSKSIEVALTYDGIDREEIIYTPEVRC